jgi:hypothetical protein
MAIFIEIPSSATTFCDFYAPMIVIRRDCECKCDGSRHDHAAKDSAEKHESHFVPFDHSAIEARLQIGPTPLRFNANRVRSAFGVRRSVFGVQRSLFSDL